MEYYRELLEEVGVTCQTLEWEEAVAKEQPPSEPLPAPYHPEEVYVTDYAQDMYYKSNCRSKSNYKHLTHFKEYIRRVFTGNYSKKIPTWLQCKAKQQQQFKWTDKDMYKQCKQWMRQEKISRTYYGLIFHLAKHSGGYTLHIPHRIEYEWLHMVPFICKQLSSDKSTHVRPKKYSPRYYVLLKMLMEIYQMQLPYAMPVIEQEGRQITEEARIEMAICQQLQNTFYLDNKN